MAPGRHCESAQRRSVRLQDNQLAMLVRDVESANTSDRGTIREDRGARLLLDLGAYAAAPKRFMPQAGLMRVLDSDQGLPHLIQVFATGPRI